MALGIVLVIGLVACGSDNSGGGNTPADVTGTWTGSLTITWADSSSATFDNIFVLSQSGSNVTGQWTTPDGTLSCTGSVVNTSLAINATIPCNGGSNPQTASFTFNISGSTLTATSASKLSCSQSVQSVSGTLTKQ
jgi:hypothetical protein